VPLYALRLLSNDGEPELDVWDSGEDLLHLYAEFKRHGRRWEVVQLEQLTLDTPDGSEIVDELVCRPS
jgi:hypothetical protein